MSILMKLGDQAISLIGFLTQLIKSIEISSKNANMCANWNTTFFTREISTKIIKNEIIHFLSAYFFLSADK